MTPNKYSADMLTTAPSQPWFASMPAVLQRLSTLRRDLHCQQRAADPYQAYGLSMANSFKNLEVLKEIKPFSEIQHFGQRGNDLSGFCSIRRVLQALAGIRQFPARNETANAGMRPLLHITFGKHAAKHAHSFATDALFIATG